MSVFQAAKQVSCADAASRLGLKKENGLWLCPFHDDRHPSMNCIKSSGRYYCFSCHARGDAVDLWAKVRGMSLRDAAHDLLREFGISYTQETTEEIEGRKRRELIAGVPRGILEEWRSGMVEMLNEEVEASIRVMNRHPELSGWVWDLSMARALRLQEEVMRLEAMDADGIGEEMAEQRTHRQVPVELPLVDDAMIGQMMNEWLDRAKIDLSGEERAWVCDTLIRVVGCEVPPTAPSCKLSDI